MNREYENTIYTTEIVEDKVDGCISMDLYGTTNGAKRFIGRITYFDAMGGHGIEQINEEIPPEIFEEYYQEATKLN
jgi:hypothetical protein